MSRLPMRRHSTDTVSLVFGLVFVAIAGWWLLSRYVSFNVPNMGWITAGALILVGLLGVVASVRSDRAPTAATTTPDEPEEAPARRGPAPTPDDTETAP